MPQAPSKIDELTERAQKLFGNSWTIVKQTLISDPFSVDIRAFGSSIEPLKDHRQPQVYEPRAAQEYLFQDLAFPRLNGFTWQYGDNASALLEESKRIVPLVLNSNSDGVSTSLESDYGFWCAGSAKGPGFTCSVYRKQTAGSLIPTYIICGDLEIASEEFHALACDVEYRKSWDDQFHAAYGSEIERKVSLVKWVVKWPWPLAPREYTYVLSPHSFQDGSRVVMSTGIMDGEGRKPLNSQAVAVKAYFGITASKPLKDSKGKKCRFCLYYFDDPQLPGGQMPSWLEQYVTQRLLPSFPVKLLKGAKSYPPDRLGQFGNLSTTASRDLAS